MNDLYREMTEAICALASYEPRAQRQVAYGDEFYELGIYTQPHRQVLRQFKPRLRQLGLDARLELAARLLETRVQPYASATIAILSWSVNELTPEHFETFDALLDHFYSWGTTDDFCVNVMYALVEKYPREAVKLARQWNRSPNPWKRRASVVMFTRRIGASGKFSREVLRLADHLVRDPEDLVLKGVGWALREKYKIKPRPRRKSGASKRARK